MSGLGARRQDKFSYGDFSTPEQYIPDTGLLYDFEACMNMNGTWGYRSDFNNWKSSENLIRNLIDLVSKGGNYLLNVGPTADGEIPEPSVKACKFIFYQIEIKMCLPEIQRGIFYKLWSRFSFSSH